MDQCWRCFCCCCTPESKYWSGLNAAFPDGDYLLPGGEWDPSITVSSVSRSRSRSPRPKPSPRPWSRMVSQASVTGSYVPPVVPQSRTLPVFEDFKLLRTVGKGAFGKVMLSVHIPTRILYAMKVVPKAKIMTQKQINQIVSECKILKQIRHPFCVSLEFSFQNEDYLFYVFEFAAGGMLFFHLRQEGKFHEPRARFYFGEIILAMEYLHGLGIIFRDLKPENCMLSEQGHIVLTDFGSAKMLEEAEKTSTIAGTPQYIAPEVLRGEPYSYSADWWSCGILLYEMLTGKTPFFSANRMDLYKLVLRGEFRVPSHVSPRARALLYRLINRDPDFRIGCASGGCHRQSAMEIKEHPFFSQTPMDPDEEAQYSAEAAEQERHLNALERSRRSSPGSHPSSSSFIETAGSVIRSFSVSSARRFSGGRSSYSGTPCEWTWEELERKEVDPPFKPKLSSPTDVRNFDPTLTCIPATISELVPTDRSLFLDNFDYVAPPPKLEGVEETDMSVEPEVAGEMELGGASGNTSTQHIDGKN